MLVPPTQCQPKQQKRKVRIETSRKSARQSNRGIRRSDRSKRKTQEERREGRRPRSGGKEGHEGQEFHVLAFLYHVCYTTPSFLPIHLKSPHINHPEQYVSKQGILIPITYNAAQRPKGRLYIVQCVHLLYPGSKNPPFPPLLLARALSVLAFPPAATVSCSNNSRVLQ